MGNEELISFLIKKDVLKTESLIEAFLKIDRADFVPLKLQNMAYEDRPLPIGARQTISQPYTVAFMLELLKLKSQDRVLDFGSGSGWTTALLASICKQVDAVERIESLVELSRKNLLKYNFNNIVVHQAERKLGLDGEVFDKILVSCAADTIPKALIQQLKVGGIMVIPIAHSIFKITKTGEDTLQKQEYPGFVFVPLVTEL